MNTPLIIESASLSPVTITPSTGKPLRYAVCTTFRGENILLGRFSRTYAVKAAAVALESAHVLETFPSADTITAKHVKANEAFLGPTSGCQGTMDDERHFYPTDIGPSCGGLDRRYLQGDPRSGQSPSQGAAAQEVGRSVNSILAELEFLLGGERSWRRNVRKDRPDLRPPVFLL